MTPQHWMMVNRRQSVEDFLHSRDNFSPSLISHEESREPNFCCPFPTVWSGWERDRGARGGEGTRLHPPPALDPLPAHTPNTTTTTTTSITKVENTYFLQISLSWLVFLARICREGSMIPPLRRSTKCKVDSFWML